ncbi:MAG: hypothetical protein VYE64_05700 [Planctomycetota bacterium]|nr:hypothetical protein [Planctomycetota bacterium]
MKTPCLIVAAALVLMGTNLATAQFGQPPVEHQMPTNSRQFRAPVSPQNISTNVPSGNTGGEFLGNTTNGMSEYDYVLSNLETMQAVDSSTNAADDWFVVGGMLPRRDGSIQVKFNKFQGEQYVAQRVADFVQSNNNNCRYQIFGRANSEEVAEEMVDKLVKARIKQNHQVRQARIAIRQAEINRMRMQSQNQGGGFGGYGGFGTYGGGGLTGGGNCGGGGGGG